MAEALSEMVHGGEGWRSMVMEGEGGIRGTLMVMKMSKGNKNRAHI